MMLHVFVETNWVVDYVDPSHLGDAPRVLLERAQAGDLALHLPSCCVVEARRAIQNKASARRKEANALRDFLGLRRERGEITVEDDQTVRRELDLFEGAWSDPAHVDAILQALCRSTSGIDVFPLNDRMLVRLAALGAAGDIYLEPFDQAVLAAVLGRAEELAEDGAESLTVFRSASQVFRGWGPETGGEGAGIYFRHREGAEPPETREEAGRRMPARL